MYTRCPKCSTVFRITATQLRVAEGEVRCGNCTISFNALAELTDDLPELTDAVLFDDDRESEENPEADADNHAADLNEQDQQSDNDNPIEATLEFDAPEVSWSRFFVSAESAGQNESAVAIADGEESGEPDQSILLTDESRQDISPLDRETRDPDEWTDFLSDLGEEDAAGDDDTMDDSDDGLDSVDLTEDQPGIFIAADKDDFTISEYAQAHPDDPSNNDSDAAEPPLIVVGAAPDLDTDYVVAEEQVGPAEAAYEFSAGSGAGHYIDERDNELPALFADDSEDDEYSYETNRDVPWRSLIMISLLAASFLIQLLHYNRDSLAAHPEYGGVIRSIYSGLGSPLYPDWELSAFKVRGTEAVAGRSAAAALDILATIEVVSDKPVGLPLVRVALHDRWATPVASRVFYPSEYLRSASQLPDVLPNGTTLQIEVSVIDPGTEAQSYVIDVCIPNRSNGLQCQLSRDPFQS